MNNMQPDQTQENRVVFLRGKKTMLRPLSKADLQTIVRWMNDPEIREFVSMTLPMYESKEEEWLGKLGSDDKNIVLGIETVDGKYIGNMGIHNINWINRTCTTGAVIGEKEYQGQGYGTDAKMAVLDYIFNTLDLRKVYSDVVAYNERSLKYSKNCGYQPETCKVQHIFKNGRYWDLIGLALFKENWLPIWEKYQETRKVK